MRRHACAPSSIARERGGDYDGVMVEQSKELTELLQLLELERLDRDLFLGDPGPGERRLFGGLVAAQSVVAAYRTVDEGHLHSLHAYFLRPGKHRVPIRYVVYRIRDGRTFTTRDVVAYQSGEAIFNLSCSFARPEQGISHQAAAPDVPGPDGLPDWDAFRNERNAGEPPPPWIRYSPIEIRSWQGADDPSGEIPRRRVWVRPRGTLPDDDVVHAAVLVYASDRGLIATVRHAHGIGRPGSGAAHMASSASLDHAMWFHHPPRFDDWILYTSESPAAHNARALIFGEMYDRRGVRLASVAQEGLIRAAREHTPAK
jgi:acyl-CoA thioesterase-2